MVQKKQKIEKSVFSQMEEDVLEFWDKSKTFEKSLERPGSGNDDPENYKAKGNYNFYDGPPFITGMPHYATLLPSIAKDIIPRYWTMKGYRVDRVWGWDCHGLPAENKVEQQLGLKNKKDIEKLGMGKFIDACRTYVDTGTDQWRWYIDRIGRWADMDNAYKTMDLEFMESVIWAFKKLYEDDLIYEGYRTSLHCPRCATPLSKFEITMDAGSYKDVEDETVVVRFAIKNEELRIKNFDTYILAWTTTPWTLPGNLALAVNKNIDYVQVEFDESTYILAQEKLEEVFAGKEYKIIKNLKGSDLLGLEYEPVFDLKNETINNNENTFKVYHADFVSTEEGTGVVHIAPNFGEDDFNLGKEVDLPMIELMDENGAYTEEAGEWSGFYFKKANTKSLSDLGNKLFLQEKHTHSYPFCYRCNTRLIHKTQKAWYMRIDRIREKMIKNNKTINWVPEHFKEGRFEYNLEKAPDWCLSRSRYWGSPIPVWKCESCGKIKVLGSLKEIEDLGGKKIDDLHRPKIDEVEFKCSCGGTMKRVPEVLDCWFESGAMPFAQFHYPMKKEKDFSKLFPADFIIEYTGQLRGWFYYLHVLASALFDSVAFKNVIVTGVLAGTDGRKMSKSFGNYPDPRATLDKYGSDALRMYFMTSPIMSGGDMTMSEKDIQDAFRKNVILLWNVVKFYDLFAQEHNFSISENLNKEPESENILDQWIMSRLNQLTKEITENLEAYNLPLACRPISIFIDDLSTWYLRRSRDRFKSEDKNDLQNALKTTSYVLLHFSKIIAPIMPFISEQIWQKITGNNFENEEKSVHLEKWPEVGNINNKILEEMNVIRKIAELGLAKRDEAGIKVRQPLNQFSIFNFQFSINAYIGLIKDELNVKNVKTEKGEGDIFVKIDTEITEELKLEGFKRELVRIINNIRKNQSLVIADEIKVYYKTSGENIEKVIANKKLKQELLKDVLASDIVKGIDKGLEGKKTKVNDEEAVFVVEKIN